MRQFDSYRFIDRVTRFDAETFNRIWASLDARLADNEALKPDLENAIHDITSLGLQRIQDTLGPLVTRLARAAELGFLVAQSSNNVTLTVGQVNGFTIQDEDQRNLFTPTPFLAAASDTVPERYAVLRLEAYNRLTGVLEVTVLACHDTAGAVTSITDDAWTIAASSAVLTSISDTLQLAATARDQAVAAQGQADEAATAAGNHLDAINAAIVGIDDKVTETNGARDAAVAAKNTAVAAATSATNDAATASSAASAAQVAKITWRGAWSGATAYALNDAVGDGGASYICKLAHTNHQPPNTTYWDVLAAKGTSGAGTGDMIGANNLSDVADPVAARSNLGLGSGATLASTAIAQTANNLSDLASASTARSNLGLGTAATHAAGDFAQAANNLADLADDAAARGNLGLGGAATKNVGTTAGTVAAGDDSRITGATPSTRTVATSGLAGGGGDLSANRTIDVPKSSNAQAIAGIDDATAMTPVRVKDAITQFAVLPARSVSAGGLATGGGDLSTNRVITVPAATQADAEAGTDNATVMTPLRTAEAIAALGVQSTRQVNTTGLATGGGTLAADRTINVPKSSNAQAIAGTDDTTAMTPVRVKDAINALSSSARGSASYLQGAFGGL